MSSGQALQSQKNKNQHQQQPQQQQDHIWIQERHGLLPGGDGDLCRNTSNFNGMGLCTKRTLIEMAGRQMHRGIIEKKLSRTVLSENTHWQSELSSPYTIGKADPTRHQGEDGHVRWRR